MGKTWPIALRRRIAGPLQLNRASRTTPTKLSYLNGPVIVAFQLSTILHTVMTRSTTFEAKVRDASRTDDGSPNTLKAYVLLPRYSVSMH